MVEVKWVYTCPIQGCGKPFDDKNAAYAHLAREHKAEEVFPLRPVVKE